MHPFVHESVSAFNAISLAGLNEKAEMLDRLDRKYVVPRHRMIMLLEGLLEQFDVLEIDGQREFSYVTTYFDDQHRSSYYNHHQGRRQRWKVRVRHYVDAGFRYLEVKTKERRSMTVKRRLKLQPCQQDLDASCMEFISSCHRQSYDTALQVELVPVLTMAYRRITLVAKDGGERLTIDTDIQFTGNETVTGPNVEKYIIETKSARGNGLADRVLRSLHVQPTKHVSKYCVGMAATQQTDRRNTFLPAMRRLELEPAAAQQVSTY
jgi:VTC domain